MTQAEYGAYRLTDWQSRLLEFAQRQAPNWLGRRLALLARRLVLSGRRQPIDASAEGFRLRVHVTDNVSERKYLFMPRFVDPVERAYLTEHLTPDGVFLDIGANAGIYTLSAARAYAALGRSGYALAVEANPTMQQRLLYNVALNQLEAHARLAPVALSNRDGEVTFSLSSSNLGESGLLAAGGETLRVPGLTLASLLTEHGITRVDGMKIDVEGMEDVILAPFIEQADPAILPRFIIIENSADQWHVDLPRLFASVGYRMHYTGKMNTIYRL
jgi:FkbM family methyltransferase